MWRQDEHGYYSHRMAEEAERGDKATHRAAAAAHYELSCRYGILAAQLATGTPKLTLIDGGKVEPPAILRVG